MINWWSLLWLTFVVLAFLIGRYKGFWMGFFHARACLPHTRAKFESVVQTNDDHGCFRTCPKCGSTGSLFTLPWGV